jgi:acid phosphatase (class B)
MFKRYGYGFVLALCLVPAIYWGLVIYSEDVCGRVHCVSVGDIQNSIKDTPPMSVGFDIDETVLFASPVFYHVAGKQCSGALIRCMETLPFWEEANTLDSFSLPKQKGIDLVRMHLTRGDTVYFITARTGTATETVSETLRKLFHAPHLPSVIFSGFSKTQNLKIKPIKEHDIKIFYGDSDADMEAAIAAGARPIRILRAANTLESHTPPHVGAYREEVVRDSGV